MIENRLTKLRQELKNKEVDGILISQPENRRYLSGFTGSAGELVITQDAALLATDFRYVEQVKKEAPGYTLFEIKGRLSEWFPALVGDLYLRRLGFEASAVSFSQHQTMTDSLKQKDIALELVPLEGVVETLRAIKEPQEIEKIRRAVAISDRAFEQLTDHIRPGLTEKDAAWMLEKIMREAGSGAMPFEVIVAAGPNSALPHARPSDHPIADGEPVVIDFGARYDGYVSDCTRTLCLGKPDATFEKVYGIVQKAQETAIAGIKAGINGQQADALARDIIKNAGYGDNFGHGLGHSLGLAVHENIPRLSPLAPPDPLADGMVFSIEPGIYLPGWGGIRIEDLAVMENGRVTVMSRARKWHRR